MALKVTTFFKDFVTSVTDVADQAEGERLVLKMVCVPREKATLWDDTKDHEGTGLTGFEPDTWKFRAWFDDETQTVKTARNPHGH